MRALRTLAGLLIVVAVVSSCEGEKPADTAARPPDEAGAIAAIKEINTAQRDYIRRTRRYAQRNEELITEKLLAKEPVVEGYTVSMLPSPDAVRYTVTATPRDPGAKHFYSDESGIVRSENGAPATKDSAPLSQ